MAGDAGSLTPRCSVAPIRLHYFGIWKNTCHWSRVRTTIPPPEKKRKREDTKKRTSGWRGGGGGEGRRQTQTQNWLQVWGGSVGDNPPLPSLLPHPQTKLRFGVEGGGGNCPPKPKTCLRFACFAGRPLRRTALMGLSQSPVHRDQKNRIFTKGKLFFYNGNCSTIFLRVWASARRLEKEKK